MKYANSRNGQKEIELVRAELAPPFATALRWAAAFPLPLPRSPFLPPPLSGIFLNDF